MPDDNEGDPDGGDPEGDPKDGNGKGDDGDPQKKDGVTPDDLKKIKEQLEQVTNLAKKQNEIIEKLTGLGDDGGKQKTEAERIEELESTVKVLSQKLETDARLKQEADKKAREKLVDKLITEQPSYKDMRDDLLKADPNLLQKIVSTKPPQTTDPIHGGRGGGTDWAKKLAAATERRQKRNESRASVRL